MNEIALQDNFSKEGMCFGCGPKNSQGLQIKSFVGEDHIFAHFTPKKFHQAFENVLSGGIIGTLLDCHSNWSAAYFIMKKRGVDVPPCTVTANFSVQLLAVTPMDQELTLKANLIECDENKAKIHAKLFFGQHCSATCDGLFIAVKPGHPAYHRW